MGNELMNFPLCADVCCFQINLMRVIQSYAKMLCYSHAPSGFLLSRCVFRSHVSSSHLLNHINLILSVLSDEDGLLSPFCGGLGGEDTQRAGKEGIRDWLGEERGRRRAPRGEPLVRA